MGEVLLSDVKGGREEVGCRMGFLEDDEGDSLLGCCGGIMVGVGWGICKIWRGVDGGEGEC